MANKEKSAELVSEIINVFRCPICHSPMKVIDFKSIICSNHHTFDFAKQGYVNMMTRPSNSHYNKKLFEARQKMIMKGDLYALLHEKISEIIKEHSDVAINSTIMLDAGCGEGSHLQKVLDECNNDAITGIGVDISKEGIIMAAKKYKNSIWLVGDLANTPLADQSGHIILNLLSPANYMGFKRVLAPAGIVIKVVPGPNYLKELREAFFMNKNMQTYDNDDTVSLFKQHFDLVDHSKLSYSKELKQAELMNLVQMSPLAWNANKEQMDTFMNQCSSEITVELDILVGVNKHPKGDRE
jgi:23S rRNA (guanine745-N1)-methyltransferase